MSELPREISQSHLWSLIGEKPELATSLTNLRGTVEVLAGKLADCLPDYTDHSIRHMDALWEIPEKILSADERGQFTASEAFLLGASFYMHDIGMAVAVTEAGLRELRGSDAYSSALARGNAQKNQPSRECEIAAVRIAARQLHAQYAQRFALEMFPGVNRFLIEPQEIREKWGLHIGLISASHQWSLAELDQELGKRGRVPDPLGSEMDLGYVACMLRVCDFAHMNAARAPYLERLLRSHISTASALHWKAQENATGPVRQGNWLVYGCSKPIANVDAWWLLYEMARDLDREVGTVAEYLAGRAVSVNRFSLEGVKGVKSPKTFAAIIQPSGFEPVEVKFHPESMKRLVDILAGQTLYGHDTLAPIRELLQNACDSVNLRRACESATGAKVADGLIGVSLFFEGNAARLEVEDNGVGMNEKVMTDYLLGVAADYWHSVDYYGDFPEASRKTFKPIGRFGIGFLSVFKLGSVVEVDTQRFGCQHLRLKLYGVGRRGEISMLPPRYTHGTIVRVFMSRKKGSALEKLAAHVACKAPMVKFPIEIRLNDRESRLDPGWWRKASQEEIYDFVNSWTGKLRSKAAPSAEKRALMRLHRGAYSRRFTALSRLSKWPGEQPEVLTESARIVAMPEESGVLLCSNGFAVTMAHVDGMTGIADIPELQIDATRSRAIDWNAADFRRSLELMLLPKIVGAMNDLATEGNVPERFGFISRIGQIYGCEVLKRTKLPWVCNVKKPGDMYLCAPADFIKLVGETLEILIAYNVGAWNASETVHSLFPSASRDALIVPISSSGEPRFGISEYPTRTREGPLSSHYPHERYQFISSGHQAATRLIATLTMIAEAWEVRLEDLINSPWRASGTDYVCSHLSRERLARHAKQNSVTSVDSGLL